MSHLSPKQLDFPLQGEPLSFGIPDKHHSPTVPLAKLGPFNKPMQLAGA
jgi:hypothetical protein